MSDPPTFSATTSAEIPTIIVRPHPTVPAPAPVHPAGPPAPGGGGGSGGGGADGTSGSGAGQPADVAPADAPVPVAPQGQYVYWLRKWELSVTSPSQSAPADTSSDPFEGNTMQRGFGPFTRANPEDATLPEVTVTAKRDPPQPGKKIDLSEFHLTFEVKRAAFQTPASLVAHIYNVGDDLMQRIASEFTRVTLSAGYQNGPYGVIFDGVVVWFERGRENATDTVLVIHANEWDQAWNGTVMNDGLPEGATHEDVVKAVLGVMTPYGISLGVLSALDPAKSPRARAMVGMARDQLRDIAQANDAMAFIDQDGKLNVLKKDDVLSTPAIVLNTSSGMIGVPRMTLGQGVAVTSLLNPGIKPGASIRINQKELITRIEAPAGGTGGTKQQIQDLTTTQQVAADGGYKIYSVTHHGDNRGNPWYSDIMTMPMSPQKMKPSFG